MKYDFGTKLTAPTHTDRFVIRVQGGMFYLGFGMDKPTFDDSKASEQCDIHAFMNMAPALAKVLRDKLIETVGLYEANFGEIKTPTPPPPPAPPPPPTGGWQASGSGSGGGASN